MPMCEKCWGKAYLRSRYAGESQAECYHDILKEVEESGKLCTPQEQAGDWWDEENQRDRRDYDPMPEK